MGGSTEREVNRIGNPSVYVCWILRPGKNQLPCPPPCTLPKNRHFSLPIHTEPKEIVLHEHDCHNEYGSFARIWPQGYQSLNRLGVMWGFRICPLPPPPTLGIVAFCLAAAALGHLTLGPPNSKGAAPWVTISRRGFPRRPGLGCSEAPDLLVE